MELRHKAVAKLVREAVGRKRYEAYEAIVANIDYERISLIADDILVGLPAEVPLLNTLEELDAYVGKVMKSLLSVGDWQKGDIELTVVERDVLVSILIERLNQLHLFCEKSINDKGLVELVKQGMEDVKSRTAKRRKQI